MLERQAGRLYYEARVDVVALVEARVQALARRLAEMGNCARYHTVLYDTAALFRGTQAKVHFREEPTRPTIFMLLCETQGERVALLDDAYCIELAQWQAAPLRERCYRCLHLVPDRLLRLSFAPEPAQPPELMQVESPPEPVPLPLSDDPLEALLAGAGCAARYCQLLLDRALLQRFRADPLDALTEYQRFCVDTPAYSHAASLLGVLYGAVRYRGETAHALLEAVLELEAAQLRAAPQDPAQLYLHRFVYETLPHAPIWLAHYQLQTGCYWRRLGALYEVHALWLCKLDLGAPVMRDGVMQLDEQAFTQHFLPALYGELLRDLFDYLVCVVRDPDARERDTLEALHRTLHGGTLAYYHEGDETRLAEFYCALPLSGSLVAAYDWALEFGCASTATAQLLERRLASSSGREWRSLEFERATLPDIEALVGGDFMPPCMLALLAPQHLKEGDRRTATAYLAEMQYEHDEVVAYLGRANDAREISAKHKHFTKRAQHKKTARHSPYCDSVMTRAGETLLVCPYPQRLSQARRPSGSAECRAECASHCAAGFRGTLLHPLDFVAERVMRASQNK